MIYIEENENSKKYYSVDYDKEKLLEILEKLKDYSYIAIGHEKLEEKITNWPITNNIRKKRVISLFNKKKRKTDISIYPETIEYHVNNNHHYVTYEYSYIKLPDLYAYIDLIVNDRSITNYKYLFKNVPRDTSGNLNMYYIGTNRDQLVLEGIINYISSPELTNHNFNKDEKAKDENYNYKGLNELYKETLKCIKFKLIAIKKYLKEPQPVDVLSLKKVQK